MAHKEPTSDPRSFGELLQGHNLALGNCSASSLKAFRYTQEASSNIYGITQ